MRRVFNIVLLSALLLNNAAFGQDVTILFSSSSMTVREAFDQIERQSGMSIAYNEATLNIYRTVSLPAGQITLDTALRAVLAGSGSEYSLSPEGQIVIILSRTDALWATYGGTVRDRNGVTLPGAAVINQQTGEGVVTDSRGRYEIRAIPGQTVLVTHLGFTDATTTLGTRTKVDFTLDDDSFILEDAVVIGYGAVKRKDLTTAVSVVSTKDVDMRPIVSAASILQGKAAGVQVIQPSGMPGTGLSVRVRGSTSVLASNEPLYVVDGIPTDDILNLSADDIETMQVLKDASSSAIYGARAANGVVLITTRRGQVGRVELKFNSYAGVSRLGRKIQALDTKQYRELMTELAEKTVTVPSIPLSENRYTDWTDELFGTGINQNYQVSLSNGSENIRYHLSAGHTRERGIVNKASFERTNFRANVDNDMFNWLSAGVNVGYSHNSGRTVYQNRSSMRAGSILSAINTPPFMQVWNPEDPSIYDEDAYGSRILNPMAANAADMTNSSDRLTGSLSLDFKPFRNFSYRASYSVNIDNSRSDYYLDPLSTSDGRMTKGYVAETVSRNFEWLFENIVNWSARFGGRHELSAMAGATMQRAQWKGNRLAGYDLPEAYPHIHSFAVANQIDEDETWASSSAWSMVSLLGRINYNYDDRYLLTANVRYDGSSRFAPGHRWGWFPSVSAAWRLSNEDFMQEARSRGLDDLKLRAGYGINGNMGGIGNYSYLASMTARKVAPTAENSYPGLAITPNTASNPELTWEKTRQVNIGVDASLFSSRLMLTVDAYYKITDDLLLTVNLPDNVNLPGGITRNDGRMENKGFELELSTKNLPSGDFRWDTDFNLSLNRNKLLKLGLNKVYYYAWMYTTGESAIILKEGLPLGSFFGYRSLGVNVDTGDIDYEDVSGNGTIGPEDRMVIGCAQPKFTFGLTNEFFWKGLSLSVFLSGSYGNQIFNASRIDTEGMVDFKNQSTTVLRRWMRPGMETDVPRSGNVANIHNSSRFVEDGGYLRLKSVTLSYTLPPYILGAGAIRSIKVFATGQNLLTLTRYSGYDPEVNAYGASSVALGVDYGTYPQSKAAIFGINLIF